jgi:RNA polymerase sigma-54 factor
LDRLKISENSSDTVELARRIIEDHLEHLGSRDYDKIKKNLNARTPEIKEAIELITSLNPHPISVGTEDVFSRNSVIIPDYQIEIEGEEIIVSLPNSKVGSVRLGSEAVELSKKKLDKKSAHFLKMKMEDARWLEDALRQRDNTMMNTMKIIVTLQRAFFLTGDRNQLNPMILKDVADRLDLDVSTISRVTSRKYVQTPYGIFHVKDLFVQSFTNNAGDLVTTNEIQEVLAEIVEKEDKSKPLNDSEIQSILKEKGFPIARRTVAKYRENLGIPVSLKRRVLI